MMLIHSCAGEINDNEECKNKKISTRAKGQTLDSVKDGVRTWWCIPYPNCPNRHDNRITRLV